MCKLNERFGLLRPQKRFHSLCQRGLSLLLVPVLLLLAGAAAGADDPDDQYLHIYSLIERADALSTQADKAPALAKYREAQVALRRLCQDFPDWNKTVVAFRTADLANKVAKLSEPAPTPPAAGGAAARAQAEPAADDAGAAGQVKVTEAGAEPRKALRLHPKEGDQQSLNVTLKLAMDMGALSQGQQLKLPPLNLGIDVTVKKVSPDGTIAYEVAVSDAGVGNEPGALAPLVESMKAAAAGCKGVTAAGVISDRGVSQSLEVKGAASTAPQGQQIVDQLKELFTSSVVLPEEAVGTGAQWQSRRPVHNQGMTLQQAETYQLTSVDGDRLTTKGSLTQSAHNQKIQSPMMPGTMVDVTKFNGQGTSETVFDLTHVLPVQSTIKSQVEMSMKMSLGGQSQAFAVKTSVEIQIQSK